MNAKALNPILNVSSFAESVAWFETLGWTKSWDWHDPPTFGAVCSGGGWMSIWVDDVDAVHRHCVAQGIEVAFPPTDMPWNVREMHVRHPDGHVFRIGQALGEDPE